MLIRLIRENMPNCYHKLLQKVISRNSYFAHAENILVAMLVDKNESLRQQACQLIIKSRRQTRKGMRKFIKPTVNFGARAYNEMINLNDCKNSTEPPLVRKIPDDKLADLNFIANMIENIPCHTQSVERVIQSVSNAAHNVFGEENRHARVCANLQSRAVLPQTRTKSDYINFI